MNKLLRYFVLSIILIFTCDIVMGQISRRLTVGRLSWTLDSQGASWMSDVAEPGQIGPHIWYNWQPWPSYENDIGYHGVDVLGAGEHSGHGKAMHGQYSWWCGSTSWTSPPAGQWGPSGAEAVYTPDSTYGIFVNDNGPVTLNSLINTIYEAYRPPKHVRRVAMPAVTIDGTLHDPVAFDPTGNPYTVKSDLSVDGMLEAKWADPMGVTFHEKRYAWSHPLYETMIVSEVVVTNTGDCNATISGIEKPGQTLTDFWLGVKHNLADINDWTDFGSFEHYNGEADWLVEYDPVNRYYWNWDGNAADIPGDDQFDPRGGPIGVGQAENPTGEFTTPEVAGYAFLYISDGPENTGTAADDPSQPATFRYRQYQNMFSPVQGIGSMTDAWNWMTAGDGAPAYQTGFSSDPYQPVQLERPHYDPVFGVGPYDLAANDSIKIVVVFAVGAIPEARAIELGDMVKKGDMELLDAKQEIYEGGRDSLFAQFARAKVLYDNGLNAPFLPDPPTNLIEASGIKEATLSWDPVNDADKYRIYRAIGGIDNGRVYDMIHETTETSYVDENLTRGTNYFYYVTAVKGDLESSHFFNRTNKEVVPTRPFVTEADWQEKVRVVPNPLNVKGNTYIETQAHNATGFNFDGGFREQNTMLFVNIPEQCIIRIYNSVGDLIKTLEHTANTGDARWSPILTDDNIVPASGIYLYTIEATAGPLKGQVAMGKLVIIR